MKKQLFEVPFNILFKDLLILRGYPDIPTDIDYPCYKAVQSDVFPPWKSRRNINGHRFQERLQENPMIFLWMPCWSGAHKAGTPGVWL